MTVTLNLSPEAARRLSERAARSGLTLQALLEQLVEESAESSPAMHEWTPAEWVAEWRTWTASHRTVPAEADDDRESIYSGRGE